MEVIISIVQREKKKNFPSSGDVTNGIGALVTTNWAVVLCSLLITFILFSEGYQRW